MASASRLEGPRLSNMAARAALFLLGLRVLGSSAQVSVIAPHSLAERFRTQGGRIIGSTATFGAPFYGDSVLGRLVYGKSKDKKHCTGDDYDVDISDPTEVDASAGGSAEALPINIVLVDRGSCSFVKKVEIAASKGAHAVLIVNNNANEDLRHIIVADDGYGDNIHIPSILISKEDGDILKQEVNKGNNDVLVELNWDIPTDDVVTVDLWMSSASRESLKFLREFSPLREKLNEVVRFVPHMYVFSLDSKDPKVYSEICMSDDGKLCAEDPDASGTVTGKDVLLEDVRQLCIHDHYKVAQKARPTLGQGKKMMPVMYAKQYWDYVEKVADRCPIESLDERGRELPADKRFGKACSEKLMKQVGIDAAIISECVEKNQIRMLEEQKDFQAWSPRALRINGWRYSGVLDPDLVVRAICAGFIHEPWECDKIIRPRNPFSEYHGAPTAPPGVRWSTFLSVLIVLVSITAVGALLYKRHLKKDVRTVLREEVMLEVQAQMGEYSKLGH